MGFFFFHLSTNVMVEHVGHRNQTAEKKKMEKNVTEPHLQTLWKVSDPIYPLIYFLFFIYFLVLFLCLSCQPNDLALFQLMSLYLSISLSLYLSILRFSVEFPFQLFFFLFVLLFFFSWIWSFFVNPQSVKRCHRVHLCECVGLFCVNVWVSFVNLIRPLLSVLLGLFCQSY